MRAPRPIPLDAKVRSQAKKALEAALAEGEASGPPRPFDPEAFLMQMHAKWQRRGG
jgi:Arc/MetJ-type ribon-helix-helix transcriptional regulator